jgi:hypothetical protein
MSTSSGKLRAEISISDPWEVASCLSAALRGSVTRFAGDAVLVRLDEPVSINGVLVLSALATPRHVGVTFERSGRSFAANIVLSAREQPSFSGEGEPQPAPNVHAGSIATIGAVSLND